MSLRVLRDRALAEEVAQEVMVEVWRKADGFDPDRGRATGWITTLAHRRAVDRVRSEQAGRDRDDRVSRRDEPRAFDVVADEIDVRLDHWQVRQALAILTDRQREAIEVAVRPHGDRAGTACPGAADGCCPVRRGAPRTPTGGSAAPSSTPSLGGAA